MAEQKRLSPTKRFEALEPRVLKLEQDTSKALEGIVACLEALETPEPPETPYDPTYDRIAALEGRIAALSTHLTALGKTGEVLSGRLNAMRGNLRWLAEHSPRLAGTTGQPEF